MNFKTIVIILAFLSCSETYSQKKIFKITDFGAVANNEIPNTKSIQQAIDACSASGGGVVLVPKNAEAETDYLTGTILLKNNVELRIDSGAVLLGSINYSDYQAIEPFIDGVGQSRGTCLIGAADAENIAITGKGWIDGQGDLWKAGNNPDYSRRPFLLRILRCNHCLLKDAYFRKSAAWMCNFDMCKNIIVDHIEIYNNVNANNDGIDIDACQNVMIKNCTINSSDDAICFKTTRGTTPCQNIEVKDNDITSKCGGIKWGTESMGDFTNFTLSGNYIHDTNLGGIKILSADGANISNIRITNTRMQNVNVPIFICIKNRLNSYHSFPKRAVGTISDITIDGLSATACLTTGILITGMPGQYIGRNIQFNNITLSGLGNKGTVKDADKTPDEKEDAYPEINRIGILPAYGAYIRHARGVIFKNMSFPKKQPDLRYAVVFDDTDNTDDSMINFIAQKEKGKDALPLVNRINMVE